MHIKSYLGEEIGRGKSGLGKSRFYCKFISRIIVLLYGTETFQLQTKTSNIPHTFRSVNYLNQYQQAKYAK